MKPTMKKVFTTFVALLLIVNLSGCSLFGDFDAQKYTKGCLDAVLKGEFSDYVEMTGMTQEEAEKEYEQRLDGEIQAMGIANLSDEMEQKYRELYKSIYGNCKYEVGEAKKNEDDSFTVPVTVQKLVVFEGCMEEVTKKLTTWATKNATATEDEVINETLKVMHEYLSAKLEKPEYKEASTIEIKVTGEKEGAKTVYTISESDYTKIIYACMDAEAMTAQ